jgi:glycosyltransferase involved in cell wall biosynthesis
MHHHLPSERSWLLIMGSSDPELLAYARSLGIEPVAVLDKRDLPRSPAIRALREREPADCAAIVTADWERQLHPQLYELGLLLLPVQSRWILDAGRRSARLIPRARLSTRASLIPVSVAGGVLQGVTSLAAAAAPSARSRRPRRRRSRPGGSPAPSMLAIWVNQGSARVGGAITHVGGIMRGFERAGLETALITTEPISPELRERVGRHELTRGMPARVRATGDLFGMAVNAQIAEATDRTTATMTPAFIYQRHKAFLSAPLRAARRRGIPLVLEFNNSETWARETWLAISGPERGFDPLLKATERMVVARADLIVAVSEHAATMAREVGAGDDQIIVVPNAVDIEEIDRMRAQPVAPQASPTIGWVGSFGVWHGAEVLVEALASLPDGVRALMIGDGDTRGECMALAQRLGVGDRLEWTGALPHHDAVARLAGCDLLASPHVQLVERPFFGSPTKLFEFMALGRPIVASRLEQLGDVLEDGRTAILVDPGSPTDLARGISEVLADPERAATLAANARATAQSAHDWSDRARQITDALRDRELIA